ncbi:type II toxin-antitoxin system YafQ family toxin [Rhodomicrobium sp.]|uniref:type II toxin-antitoxin system YafQ family toxin n=1 Tax=Rhodomicrobium sp. TaxID=2720632 RepID=UPI0039E590D5
MRTILRTKKFKKDYKRVLAGPFGGELNDLLLSVAGILAADENLPARFRDHALTGNWAGHRECHLKPDLLLIYDKPDDETLVLRRLGSHSDLLE